MVKSQPKKWGQEMQMPGHQLSAGVTNSWTWSLSGKQCGNSPGAVSHDLTVSGQLDAELAGEVLIELAEQGQFWDVLDSHEPFTFTISRNPLD